MIVPRPYQLEGRDFLAPRKVALLADEMRVGKTGQALLAAHKAGAQTILVVTRAIAVPQWERAIPMWYEVAGAAIAPRYKVMGFERATAWWQDGARGTVDVFIPDECHFGKNPESLRTKMIYGRDGFAWRAGATWALSGTPAPKHAAELWPMLAAFGCTRMGYWEFAKWCCTFDWTGTKITGTRADRIVELRAMLATIMLRRTRRQVRPDMPDIGFNFLNDEYEKGVDYAMPVDVEAPPMDPENRIDVALAKAKPLADEVLSAVRNGLLKQTVVFGWHVEPLEFLTRVLNAYGVRTACLNGGTSPRNRELAQGAFKRGELQVICANISTAGTAIDLSAASHGYFLELDWVPGNNVQAANRLVSMDKDEAVTIDVVTMPGTVDDRVQKVLLRRTEELSKLY